MWPGRVYSDLDRLADENWLWVIRETDLPEKGWMIARLSRRDDPNISRITRHVHHADAGQFTYKFQLRPQAPDGFGSHHRLQRTAYDNFPHSAELTLPRTVFVDETRQVSLMTFVPGHPVSEEMKRSATPQAQLDLLTKCGAWLDAFHRSQRQEARSFRPRYVVNHYQDLKDRIAAGTHNVAARGLFLRGIDKIAEIVPQVTGTPTVAAMQHGDFHLRNLIWNDGQLAGIDISNDRLAPVGHDIAKVLLDFTTVFKSSDGLEAGQIVHSDTCAAFFDGYRLVKATNPSVRFLLFARILATLKTVPADRDMRTDAKQRTLQRLKPIARHAFREDPAPRRTSPKETITVLLTKSSLEKARQGQHDFVNLVARAVAPLGHDLTFRRNTQQNRDRLSWDALSLVHMSTPVGPKGLVFRRAYAGPFWHLETRSARWEWEIAQTAFVPEQIDPETAQRFFDEWRWKLLPRDGPGPEREDFIYMPLQGKLLSRRTFQTASPMDMLTTTLAQTDLPIRVTLHPSEDCTADEIAALDRIQTREDRVEVTDLPMHDALATCRFVVTENSSAAFHAILHQTPSVLFAKIDFAQICHAFDPSSPGAAFRRVQEETPRFREFLYWYWALNCIYHSNPDAEATILARLRHLGWPMS